VTQQKLKKLTCLLERAYLDLFRILAMMSS